MFLQIIRQFFGHIHRPAAGHAGKGDRPFNRLRSRRAGRNRALAVDKRKTTIQICAYHKTPSAFLPNLRPAHTKIQVPDGDLTSANASNQADSRFIISL
jgi:hypothetical protein